MGNFDESIKWLRERIRIAAEDLVQLKNGEHRLYRDELDFTSEHIQRLEHDITRYEKLIAEHSRTDKL